MKNISDFLNDEEAASLAEYGLLVGIVVVGVATVLGGLRENVASAVSRAATNINAA